MKDTVLMSIVVGVLLLILITGTTQASQGTSATNAALITKDNKVYLCSMPTGPTTTCMEVLSTTSPVICTVLQPIDGYIDCKGI